MTRAAKTSGEPTFFSKASNLVSNDTNGAIDVFLHGVLIDATWTNYGAGFPGTNGIPSLTSQVDPVIGTTVTVDVSNSYGVTTAALLFIGLQQTTIPSSWGGDLLVVPTITISFSLPASGMSFADTLPNDEALCGLAIDLQSIELDPGAAKGVSFTAGLELILGH